MSNVRCSAQLTFFGELTAEDKSQRLRDFMLLTFACDILETRLLERLRFALASVYNVHVSMSTAYSSPQREAPMRIAVFVEFGSSPVRAIEACGPEWGDVGADVDRCG